MDLIKIEQESKEIDNYLKTIKLPQLSKKQTFIGKRQVIDITRVGNHILATFITKRQKCYDLKSFRKCAYVLR